MSVEVQPKDTFAEVWSPDLDQERRERHTKELAYAAFRGHLGFLGREARLKPDLAAGKTRIGIVSYFGLPKFEQNPLNAAALALVPRYTDTPGYADSTLTTVNDNGLNMAIRGLLNDPIDAARKGHSVEYVVANALGLNDRDLKAVHETTRFEAWHHSNYGGKELHRLGTVRTLAAELDADFREIAVGEVSDVAGRVRERGYGDFFDYLTEVREATQERAETIMQHGQNA